VVSARTKVCHWPQLSYIPQTMNFDVARTEGATSGIVAANE